MVITIANGGKLVGLPPEILIYGIIYMNTINIK